MWMKYNVDFNQEWKKLDLMYTRELIVISTNFVIYLYVSKYRQNRRKYGIRFSRDNEHVSYYQQLHFEFNAEKSHPFTPDDPITVLSVHLNVRK